LPTMRLSAFVQTAADERRVDFVRLVHDSSGLEWKCSSPRKIAENDASVWAGYTNFVPATGELIPQGQYSFYYNDMAGEESRTRFTIVYPETLPKTPANLFLSTFSSRDEIMAVYDKDDTLIYFGKRKENWTSNNEIKSTYGLAEKIRICYKMNGGGVICMMPPQEL